MSTKGKFYITTAIDYSSGLPHIGHAYEKTLTDVIARMKKLIGYDVFFLSGLDEHGQKIYEKAKENNMTAQEWVDHIASKFESLWSLLDVKYDKFIRTTDEYHVKAVQKTFGYYLANNYIYMGQWESLYCVGCEEAYTESEAIKHDDGQLYCRVGHKLTTKSEESYFFKMSQFNDWIKDYLKTQKDFIVPENRANELLGTFLNEGLQDLSVSRTKQSLTWGVNILENGNHVIYVWIDALLNYITALGYNCDNTELFDKYWADENTEILHMVGKDIARFHAIYWPIMLKTLGLRLPNHIIAHGFIMAEDGRKMSKSFGNVVDPIELYDEFGSDTVRYYFTKAFLIDSDNNFSKRNIVELYNNDLANTYGNLVSRFLGMCNQYNNGIINKVNNNIDSKDQVLIDAINSGIDSFEQNVNKFNVSQAIESVLTIAQAANKYVEETKPWELKKAGKFDEINNFLFYLGNAIRTITSLLRPVLTKGTVKMIEQMNFNDDLLEFSSLKDFSELDNHKVGTSTPIFLRIA